MHDFKAMEKELGESRRTVMTLELLLEEANESIHRFNSEKLNQKYSGHGF
jgi:Mg2+ and Co2+ transporter CorA